EHAPGAEILAVEARCERHSERDRKALSERAGARLDPWERPTHRMALKRRAELAQRRQKTAVEVAVLGERGVEGRHAVPLRQNEAVAIRIVRGFCGLAQVVAVQRFDQVDGAER